jgi:putative ABC transport system permease protein
MSMLLQPFRAFRLLIVQRGFATRVVLTMAIGLTVATLMLGIVWQVQLVPLPYQRSDEIHTLEMRKDARTNGLTSAEAEIFASQLPVSAGSVTSYTWNGATYTGPSQVEVLTTNSVDSNFFEVLGADHLMLLGRPLQASDVGSMHVVLGEKTWRKYFNADPDVIGKTLPLKGNDAIVIGVISADFALPVADIAFYQSMDWGAMRAWGDAYKTERFLQAYVRIPASASPTRLIEALEQIRQQNQKNLALDASQWRAATQSLQQTLRGATRKPLLLLAALSFLVLLISAINAGQLMLVREQQRASSFALMRAIGAPPKALIGMILTESLCLSLAALLLAGLMCLGVLQLLPNLSDSGLAITREQAAQLFSDARLWIGIVGLFVINAGIAAGIALWMALRQQTAQQLRNQRHGVGRLMWIGMPGITLGILALSTAALYWYSAHTLTRQSLGLNVAGIQSAQIFMDQPPEQTTAERIAKVRTYFDAAKTLPGARDALISVGVPFSVVGSMNLEITNPTTQRGFASQTRAVVGDPVQFFDRQLLQGRSFSEGDNENSAPVLLINEQLARQYFGQANAVGQSVLVPPMGEGQARNFTVVGVLADARTRNPGSGAQPEMILPYVQYPFGPLSIMVKDAPNASRQLQNLVRNIDPNQAIYRNYALQTDLSEFFAAPNFFAQFGALFASLALMLCAFGLFAVQSFAIQSRRKEFALRQAVGASPTQITYRLLTDSLRIVIPGALLGVAMAVMCASVLQSAVYGLTGQFFIIAACIFAAVMVVLLLTLIAQLIAVRAISGAHHQPALLLAS